MCGRHYGSLEQLKERMVPVYDQAMTHDLDLYCLKQAVTQLCGIVPPFHSKQEGSRAVQVWESFAVKAAGQSIPKLFC